jgi:protein TonB
LINLSKKQIWILAMLISTSLHLGVIFYIPVPQRKEKPPIMRVSFTTLPKKVEKIDVRQTAGPKKETEKKEIKKNIKPKPKPKLEKPKEKINEENKTEVPAAREISQTPAKNILPEEADWQDTSQSDVADDSYSGSAQTSNMPVMEGRAGTSAAPIDVQTLRITKKVLPEYSAFSRKRKEEGSVVIIITIENGRVTDTELEKTSGFPRLDESAIRAAKQWRFDYNGTIRARLPIVFKLK